VPTYDYVCDGCGHEFELFQNMTDEKETDCPECHEPKLRRLFGVGAGIIFKGSGFYQTDYKLKESPKPATETPSDNKKLKDRIKETND